MGIYMFCYRYKDKEVFLKIGKAGEKNKSKIFYTTLLYKQN